MSKKFQRSIENFTCGYCAAIVVGNGYTNHCPQCLCSKHVDINPGDRASDCGGLMKPVEIEQKNGDYVIIHVCESCGHMKKNKVSPNDNIEAIIAISQGKHIQ